MDQTAQDIKELIWKLNRYTKKYDEGHPIISDKEWDELYFKLQKMEEETGIIYPDSPTQSISYTVVDNLKKVEHNHPMLSLAKTKDIEEIKSFVKGHDWCGMFKLDGLTCSLTYENGKLVSAETRGNGIIGEDILHNIMVMESVPKVIPNKETTVIDGEVICKYADFEEFADEYKHPRNFASGSIRLLDAKESAARHLTFVAWDLIKGRDDLDFFFWRLEKLDEWGFETVPRVGDGETVEDTIKILDEINEAHIYPIDGYVFRFESQKYYKSLGNTDHHFRGAMAFKFYDDEYGTELKDIEWSMGRTGILTPVAIFKPIEIDGTIVERASLHNVSVMIETLGERPEGDQHIWVIKSNQIIPQIVRAVKNDIPHDHILPGIPLFCPCCGKETKLIWSDTGVANLYCMNSACEGKLSNRIDHFFGKKGLDVKGISLATIDKLINWGWVYSIKDMYKLDHYSITWSNKPGFGKVSVNKILNAILLSQENVDLASFISALGIPLVGKTIAKEICKYYNTWEEFREAVGGDWTQFDGFGPEISNAINKFDYDEADEIAAMLTFKQPEVQPEVQQAAAIKDKVFVITGKLTSGQFKNRDALKADIEANGGKVTGSVSSKTNYLISNEDSSSAKSIKAKELGVTVITEDEYLTMRQ